MLLGEKCFICLGHEISGSFVWFVILLLTGNLDVNCRLTLCKRRQFKQHCLLLMFKILEKTNKESNGIGCYILSK